ncbi:MAG: aldose 1-epimerase family protein [Lachnospiraceae bacterium]|nr:aldose 1-epimerase family protein [Lachnospiraceae bacterium]
MAVYSLENAQIKVSVDTLGAELKSLKKVSTGTEYMWDAAPEYWKRTSPVLFPIVGSLNNGSYRCDGKEYPMSQHGFARDMEFEPVQQTGDELKFVLRATEETKAKYPFDFELELGYRLRENNLVVSWKVTNRDSREMYFSIGGHPAFMCPIDKKGVQTDYKVLFDVSDKVTSGIIGSGGTLSARTKEYRLDNGMMDITADLFDEDALIIEDNQAHKVALCSPEGQPYLTVSFDAPLFGLWSPAKKNAPFICIEPWYGRCDRETFAGDLSEREYGNKLSPAETFYAEYTITV